jgi:plastocyanin
MRPPARVRSSRAARRVAAAALTLLAGLAAARAASGATLVIHVQSADGHVLSGAVVTARPLDGVLRKPAPVRAVMDQVNRAFVPDLLVIPVGSTVEFPNSDSVSHQIYSFSPAKRF